MCQKNTEFRISNVWNLTDKVKITFNKAIAPITIGTSVTESSNMPEMPKIRTRSEAVQRPPDARAAQGRITQMIVTDGTILSARISSAAYRGCPVAMTKNN